MMSLGNISKRFGQLGLCKHLQKHLFGLNGVSYYTLADIPSNMSKVTERIEVSYLVREQPFILFVQTPIIHYSLREFTMTQK